MENDDDDVSSSVLENSIQVTGMSGMTTTHRHLQLMC